MSDVTRILSRIESGDPTAAEQLLPLVYDEPVAMNDGRPAPKVIDFGVVKALGQKLTDTTMFTEFGSLFGFPT